MRFFTKDWYRNCTVQTIQDAADAYRTCVDGDGADPLRQELLLHDETVESVTTSKTDLCIAFCHNPCGANVTQLTLTDATVLKNDGIVAGDVWLYDELYRRADGYELHILFWSEKALKELTVRITGIRCTYNEQALAIQRKMQTLFEAEKQETDPTRQRELEAEFLQLAKQLKTL